MFSVFSLVLDLLRLLGLMSKRLFVAGLLLSLELIQIN